MKRSEDVNKSKNPKLRVLNGGGPRPIPIIINCPECGARHIDEGEWATRVHHTHSCQECGMTWRPAVVPTVGVQFLPGFKNKD
jgi:rubredoxin